MKRFRDLTVLLSAGALIVIAAPIAFAGTQLINSPLLVLGGANSGAIVQDQVNTGTSLPFTYLGHSLTDNGETFSAMADYHLQEALFHIDYVLDRHGVDEGNTAEARGSISFKATTPIQYDLSGFINASNLGQPGVVEILGRIFDVTTATTVVDFSNTVFADADLQLGGALGLINNQGTAMGTLTKNHVYEFFYDARIESRHDHTSAAAFGSFNLSLATGPNQPSETPLPTVATAGVALFGAMTLRRPRRH